jgi:hypothetical protein
VIYDHFLNIDKSTKKIILFLINTFLFYTLKPSNFQQAHFGQFQWAERNRFKKKRHGTRQLLLFASQLFFIIGKNISKYTLQSIKFVSINYSFHLTMREYIIFSLRKSLFSILTVYRTILTLNCYLAHRPSASIG